MSEPTQGQPHRGILKWDLPRTAREILVALARTTDERGEGPLARTIERALGLAQGDILSTEDREALEILAAESSVAVDEGHPKDSHGLTTMIADAMQSLLRCLDERELGADAKSSSKTSEASAERPCDRCGIGICAKGGAEGPKGPEGGERLPCDACGYQAKADPEEAARERRHFEHQRRLVDWIVRPAAYLAVLSLERAQILTRADSPDERPGDRGRIDAIDRRLDDALRGVKAGRFLRVIQALEEIAELGRAWTDTRGKDAVAAAQKIAALRLRVARLEAENARMQPIVAATRAWAATDGARAIGAVLDAISEYEIANSASSLASSPAEKSDPDAARGQEA